MEMILAVIVLAIASAVSFMSYVTLNKKIEAARQSIEYLIEVKSNRTSREIAEGNNTIIQDIGLLSCQVNTAKEDINKTTKQQVTRIIYLAPTLKVLD